MNAKNNTLTLVLGGAIAATVAMSPVSAAENPFGLKPLASGYMLADNHDAGEKMKEGKCSTGKCGSSMKKKKKAAEESATAGEEKAKEGSCSGEKKAKEGSCSGEKK